MQVTDAQVIALRALLAHDADQIAPLAYQLGDQGMAGYMRLAEAALSVVAHRHFSPRFTSADLVQYVALTRASRLADGDAYDFDPVVGEDVLRFSLGQELPRTSEPESWVRAVIAILGALTDAELSTETDVDELLAEARLLVDRWVNPLVS